MWDVGNRNADGERELSIAMLWVENVREFGPGESAEVRLAPLTPERWAHLRCGDAITMYEARPVAGSGRVIEVVAPRSGPPATP